MKTTLLSVAAAFCLLASTAAHAATLPLGVARETRQDDKEWKHDKDHKPTLEERAKWEAEHKKNGNGNGKDFNYGYDKNHKVTAAEKAKWQAEHKNDRRDFNGKDKDKNFNYGYDKSHKVTPEERAKWEAEHKNDRNRDGRR